MEVCWTLKEDSDSFLKISGEFDSKEFCFSSIFSVFSPPVVFIDLSLLLTMDPWDETKDSTSNKGRDSGEVE